MNLDKLNPDREECHEGWWSQAVLDLAAVRTLGTTLGYAGGCVHVVIERPLRLEVVGVVANRHKLSPRLQSLFKVVHGAAGQMGKKAWELMLHIEKNTESRALWPRQRQLHVYIVYSRKS